MKTLALLPMIALVMLMYAPPVDAEATRLLNFQGMLTDAGGEPLPDGDYQITFTLYDALESGQIIYQTSIEVHQEDGVFSAVVGLVDALNPAIFDQDLFLGIALAGDDEMDPRIQLTATPYAMRASSVDAEVVGPQAIADGSVVRSLNGLTENVTIEAGSNVIITLGDSTIVISASGAGSPWEIAGNDIYYDTGNVGIGTTTPAHALQVVSDGERAIFGENTATSEASYGVYGKTTGTAGRGLCGIALSSSGYTYGVYARNYSTSGRAVYGNASASSGYTHGVSGQSWSSTGRGVNGLASAASGINYGVYGETYSPDGFAGYFTGGKNYFQGNVGIGMPSPAAKLHIGGIPDVDGIMFPDGTLQTTATTGGGADDDWEIVGDDIYHVDGRVYIGTTPRGEKPASREGKNGGRDPADSKLTVMAPNEGVYCVMDETDNNHDGRSALFAKRTRSVQNNGSGFGVNQTNTAITGLNKYGDSYTFGVAGYTYLDFPHTAGVLGSLYSGDSWGALAYKDDAYQIWGMYTPISAHVGGTAEVAGLRLTSGATAGYVMTSDSDGNASWQPPGSTGGDDDWLILGDDLAHPTSGTVAIGTDTPTTFMPGYNQTTLQVVASYFPAIVLDKTSGGFGRWFIWHNGVGDHLEIGHSTDPGGGGTATCKVKEQQLGIMNSSGIEKILLQGHSPEEQGGVIYLYGADDSDTTLVLDGHVDGPGGGQIRVNNSGGHETVLIYGDYNGTGKGRVVTSVVEITGGSDLSERFDIGSSGQQIKPGMVVSIDPERPGGLILCSEAYDRRVAGVVSGAGGVETGMLMGQRGSAADGELPVALVGRVYVWADATAGEIRPGDLLTTSNRAGHAMHVDDHLRASGAILGKAMTGLDEGQGLVLALISLQ